MTSYLRQQRAAGAAAVSFALAGTAASQGYASLNSDEAAADGPKLVVTQANVPEVPTWPGHAGRRRDRQGHRPAH